MKTIKAKYIGSEKIKKYLIETLKEDILWEDSDNPEFAFFESDTANQCFEYNCVRIIFIGENLRPDFNLFDYAIGFDDMRFGDRYLKCPIFLFPW